MAYVVKWHDRRYPYGYLASVLPDEGAGWAKEQIQAIRFASKAQARRLLRKWLGEENVFDPGQIRFVRLTRKAGA